MSKKIMGALCASLVLLFLAFSASAQSQTMSNGSTYTVVANTEQNIEVRFSIPFSKQEEVIFMLMDLKTGDITLGSEKELIEILNSDEFDGFMVKAGFKTIATNISKLETDAKMREEIIQAILGMYEEIISYEDSEPER